MGRNDARRVANTIRLLKNASASGSFTDPLPGGKYLLVAEGSWGGAALTLQYKGPNDTAIAVANVSLSTNANVAVDVGDGAEVKAILTGGTPSGIYADLVRVPT
jgi:hypothetical protein